MCKANILPRCVYLSAFLAKYDVTFPIKSVCDPSLNLLREPQSQHFQERLRKANTLNLLEI